MKAVLIVQVIPLYSPTWMSQKGAFGFQITLIDEQVSANEMK